MKPIKGPISGLEKFLPPGTFALVAPYFEQYQIQLTVKQERKNVLGDYRHPFQAITYHKISVNGNLNPYSFLVTLLHELAHLTTYVQYKNTVGAHGKEWKNEFKKILIPFLQQQLLPPDIHNALIHYIKNVKATTCGDANLYKALAKYNARASNLTFVDELPVGAYFRTPKDGRVFRKESKRRTRYLCTEVKTKVSYLFPGIYEVELIESVS